MSTPNTTPLLNLLREQLNNARYYDQAARDHQQAGTLIDIPRTGKTITTAYEQLRNAAEYADDLLLQRAIRRYFNRTLFLPRLSVGDVGRELIIELTQAGYLKNKMFGSELTAEIGNLAETYAQVYEQIRRAQISREQASNWVLALLSVSVENLLSPHAKRTALAYVAYSHMMQQLPRHLFVKNAAEDELYEISLFVAVHQSLFKSDLAIVRHALMHMYGQIPEETTTFIEFNKKVDELFVASQTQELKRAVSKQGAALRVLNSLVEIRSDVVELLSDRTQFNEAYEHQVRHEYNAIEGRVMRGIRKSIIFIFITKTLIGIGVEIPYDILITGSVMVMPLLINLIVPPLYMASLRLGLHVPSYANAQALKYYIDDILYEDKKPLLMIGNPAKTASTFMKTLYSLLFFTPFAFTVYILHLFHFNILQMGIFFVFLSTASFLSFRLNAMIRELEFEARRTGLLGTMRDFFYLPFILLGRWLTGKYAKLNVFGYFLDIVIEMPLKLVLRLTRQWVGFLNDKRDEIY